MVGLLFVLLLAVPVAELWVIVQVGGYIGVLNTLALLLVISAAGAWLLKQQGLATWRRLQTTLGQGQMPAKEATDGAMILFGGALLLTPGFITDAVGLLLLLPPTRAALKGAVGRWLKWLAKKRLGPLGRAGIYGARVVKVKVDEDAKRRSRLPSSRPPASPPENEDDSGSPDTA